MTEPYRPAYPVPHDPDWNGMSFRERLVVAALAGAATGLVLHPGPVGEDAIEAAGVLAVALADAALAALADSDGPPPSGGGVPPY